MQSPWEDLFFELKTRLADQMGHVCHFFWKTAIFKALRDLFCIACKKRLESFPQSVSILHVEPHGTARVPVRAGKVNDINDTDATRQDTAGPSWFVVPSQL